MKIVVVGIGYVGLVTGLCLAEKGNTVTCIDLDEEKIEKLNSKISTIFEPGVQELLVRNKVKGTINFSISSDEVYRDVDVIFIAVGTPEREDGSANLDYIFDVCNKIASNISKDCVVVVKSTVPIGTNDRVEMFINSKIKDRGLNVEVVSNPEFLSQGTAVKDTLDASRIIIGVKSKEAEEIMKKIYLRFNVPKIVVNRRSSEMIKYASNDFLALKISFINEIANFCEVVGANIDEVTKGMSYDKRIGSHFLKAGLGYGGSCFPKDTKALHWLANDWGYELKTIKATIEVNENQKYVLFRRAKKLIKDFNGKKVAVLGATFKPNTDDLREAPSIPNIRRFIEEGAEVTAYDPVGLNNLKKIFHNKIKYSNSIIEAIRDSNMAFIFTEWDQIKTFKLSLYKKYMRDVYLFDGRGCYNLIEAYKEGIYYYSIGKGINVE